VINLRKPTVQDVSQMAHLMEPHILKEALLPRSERNIIERLRDYTIAEDDGEVIGLVSISLVEVHLAELGAVVCERPEHLGRLVEAALTEAKSLGVSRVFLLAPEAAPYESLGFSLSSLADFPEKRDRQCLSCPRLPRCRQVLLQKDL